MKQNEETLYEKVKRRLLNSRMIIVLIFIGVSIGFIASTKESIQKLFSASGSPPKLTMVATVLDDRGYCGTFGWSSDGINEIPMVQNATLDIAINNPSSEAHIITSLLLEPADLYASFWAGELKVGARYDVVIDDWHYKIMEANYKEPRIPPELPTMAVKEIVDRKYTVSSGSQERFQVRLGLTRSIDFLYGTVRVIIKTDRETKLVSEPLGVVVCTPTFELDDEAVRLFQKEARPYLGRMALEKQSHNKEN